LGCEDEEERRKVTFLEGKVEEEKDFLRREGDGEECKDG
jgi:hypothetical protein